jgi:hypothetical protein
MVDRKTLGSWFIRILETIGVSHAHFKAAENRSKRSQSRSVEALDVQNFIGQVHLIVFYIVIAT